MACINPLNPHCKDCNKAGLAIFPARYAVVPKNVPATLPAPLGNKVTSVKLAHHHYALRTLREGFVYVYYEKHPLGVKWDLYSVAPDGSLWKQLGQKAIKPIKEQPECALNKSHPPAYNCIHIERPGQQGKVWLAFSEHVWSVETFKAFEGDAKLRDRRMQTFLPANWITDKGYRHGLEATQANLEQILEYQENFEASTLTDDLPDNKPQPGQIVLHKPPVTLSKVDGSYTPSLLTQQSTRYPLHMRKGQSQQMAEVMAQVGDMGSTKHPAMIMALWDAVGITHELNGFRNDAAGRIEQYDTELALKVSALSNIEGLKKALRDRAKTKTEDAEDKPLKWGPAQTATVMGKDVGKGNTNIEANKKELCRLWEKDAEDRAPESIAIRRNLHTRKSPAEFQAEMKKIDAEIARYKQAHARPDLVKNRQDHIDHAIATSWNDYAPLIDPKTFDPFKTNYEQFQAAVDKLIKDRTDDLIAWLKSPSFIDALTEFHPANISDGVLFDHIVGHAIHGINATENGKNQIEAWITDLKSELKTDKEKEAGESNLIWRSLALNQTEALSELRKTLAEAEKARLNSAPSDAVALLGTVQSGLKKFVDAYKKAIALYGAKQKNPKTADPTLGMDRLMMTVGDAIFKHFRINELADKHCESLIKYICGIRGLIDPVDMEKILVAESLHAGAVRGNIIQRLKTARTFLAADTPIMRSAQTEALEQAWEDFKHTNNDIPQIIRDARLAVVVMLIEGMNFGKMMGECALKNDTKSWAGLAASGLSITSMLFDMASLPMKHLMGTGSWSYNRLKLSGGVLSSGATAIGVVLDARDASKYFGRSQNTLGWLYRFKTLTGLTTVTLNAATTLSYAAPALERISGRVALAGAARTAGAAAVRILAFRILFMSFSMWLTVGSMIIQGLIMKFSNTELQDWCSLCPFGVNKYASDAYKTAEEQNKKLQEALLAVGV
jgi:hypothetical protein